MASAAAAAADDIDDIACSDPIIVNTKTFLY